LKARTSTDNEDATTTKDRDTPEATAEPVERRGCHVGFGLRTLVNNFRKNEEALSD